MKANKEKQKQTNKPVSALDALCAETSTHPEDWAEVSGPNLRCGVDHWFRHADGTEALVNDDQGHITVSVCEDE